MNREIRFRACIKDTKVFIFTGETPFRIGSYLKADGDKLFIGWRNEDGWFEDEVDPQTVGQYTGLKDKNGLEIYEGDLLQGSDRIVEVYWNELGIWDCRWLQYTKKPITSGLPKNEWRNSLVIGNIYENPELLK